MSLFDRRPRLRWAVPAAAGALILAGSVVGTLGAAADSGLEPRTAEQLIVDIQEAAPVPLSGTVATVADLGLPSLPMGAGGDPGVTALASGTNTLRVWSDGPDRSRLAMLARAAESDVIRNGRDVWVWSSDGASIDHFVLPEEDAAAWDDTARTPPGLDPADLPSTPQEAAELALGALDPTTEVTTSGVGSVAGRSVYELTLRPRDTETRVASVTIAVDAQTAVPLRVRVYSTDIPDPAFEVGFTSVDFARPEAALFEFTPPPGSTVTEHAIPVAGDLPAPEEPAGVGAAEPTVVGSGWSTVVIGTLPAGGLADLVEAGSRPTGNGGDESAATALALIESLPQTSGRWGTGRVLNGTLFSAILTDDGRVAIGAVSPEILGAALAAQ